jgi:hypothetical protein
MPPLESEFFPASYDATTKFLSVILCSALAVVVAVSQSAVPAAIGVLVIGLGYGYSPRGYRIENQAIVVRRLAGSVRISLESIREARAAATDDFRGCIRLWGSGGLFGYYGLFLTSKLGKSTWYVTDRSHGVVVITGAKTVVLSPDEVDRFLAALGAAVPIPLSAPPPGSSAPASPRKWPIILGTAGILLTLGVVAFAMLYSPGPPNCTVTVESLRVRDRFYPVTVDAAAVDVAHIRVVDTTSDPEWRPVTRTDGFANAHYHAGWFRTANSQKVRMYRASGTRLVLLPPKGDGVPVLLEVRDPEAFAAALRQAWQNSGS